MSKKSQKKKQTQQAKAATPVASPSANKLAGLLFVSIVILFFASGFSSLIYQVVWTRMLVLVFGATTFATSTVLAIFMGGLALGSFVAGRVSDRLQRPVFWYGALEAIIGAWSLLTPHLFDLATPIYRAVWQATHASLLELSLLRFVCTFFILIVPTTCMGATLPILARFVTTSLESVGNRVGTLYSVNTFGAVVGALVTGFVVLPALGLHSTIGVGVLINAFLCGTVYFLDKILVPKVQLGDTTTSGAENPPGADAPEKKPLPLNLKLAIGAFAVSGGIAMIYEVCWTRTLLMVIGSSTYAFTVMLSTFLIGSFVGSLLCARFIDKAKQPLLWFAIFQLCLGVVTLVSMKEFNRVPFYNALVSATTHTDPNASMLLRFLLAGSIMAPITLFLGAVFPAVVKACTTDLASVGRSVGSLYSANTLGAIVGAFLAGFVCLPMFGAERTLIYGALVNACLGLILLWGATERNVRRNVALTLLTVALMVGVGVSSSVWDKTVLLNAQAVRRYVGHGHYKMSKTYEDWRDRLHNDSQVRFWLDGACSNVGIVLHKNSKTTSLVTNGHIDASDGADMPVQSLLSGLPLLMKPDAKNVAIVGWGSGQTVNVARLFDVKDIDAIELEPAVITASKFFHRTTGAPENDPRVHLQFNDGRNFLLATDKKYDVIVSEPSNPWQSGVCNLFTREYFEICKDRLTDDGILSVWIQTAEIPPTNLCSILAAITDVFPNAIAFAPNTGNILVMASPKPLQINVLKVHSLLQNNKALQKVLDGVGVANAAQMVAHLMVSSEGMRSFVPSFTNTDDRNRLEFDVGRSYEDKIHTNENADMLHALSGDLTQHVNWEGFTSDNQAFAMAHVAEMLLNKTKDPAIAMIWCQKSMDLKKLPITYRMRGDILSQSRQFKEATADYRKAVELSPQNPDYRLLLGSSLCAENKRVEGRAELEKALQLDPKNRTTAFMLAGSYSPDLLGNPATESKEDEPARKTAEKVLQLLGSMPDDNAECVKRPTIPLTAAQAYFKLGQFDKAERYVRRYQMFVPRYEGRRAESLFNLIDRHKKAAASPRS